MNCVKTRVDLEETIKKSRFIGILTPCQSEKEAQQHIAKLYQQYPDASHIVFAYRIKSADRVISRFNDAGEPNGTAGKPIYKHLEGNDLINTLCIVIRYFGGIKLGTGGLIRAYGNTAKKIIKSSLLSEFIEYTEIKIELNYNQMQNFEYHFEKLGGIILQKTFSEHVNLIVKVPEKNLTSLTKLL